MEQTTGKVKAAELRLAMAAKLAPEPEFRLAWESTMTRDEVAEYFGFGVSDVDNLVKHYELEPRGKGHRGSQKVVVRTRQPIDTNEIADRVVALAMDKLKEALGTEIKLVVADALSEAAARLRSE
jgi:hypothetical protein